MVVLGQMKSPPDNEVDCKEKFENAGQQYSNARVTLWNELLTRSAPQQNGVRFAQDGGENENGLQANNISDYLRNCQNAVHKRSPTNIDCSVVACIVI
jgi:hypothetical protein